MEYKIGKAVVENLYIKSLTQIKDNTLIGPTTMVSFNIVVTDDKGEHDATIELLFADNKAGVELGKVTIDWRHK